MKPVEVHSPQQWDALLARLPNPHTLQSWDWGAFKRGWGWQPTRWVWPAPGGRPAAAAQVLWRPFPKTPWGMLYVPKGPALDYANLPLARLVLADLEAFARRRRAIFIKIDPDVPLAFGRAEPPPHSPGTIIGALLNERGWQYSSQQIQFKNTVLIDVTVPEADLLAAMKPKWRYNIRLARRKGVSVERGGPADLETFYRLYAATGRRNRFLIRPQAYYLDVWRRYLQASPPRAELLLARLPELTLAGLMLFYFGPTAWYMYGASDNRRRDAMPNHLLQWEAIKAAKAAGCRTYDMWGAPNVFDESDSMWGVYRFKLGFGGLTRQGLGAFDYPARPRLYRLYTRLLPKLMALRRTV